MGNLQRYSGRRRIWNGEVWDWYIGCRDFQAGSDHEGMGSFTLLERCQVTPLTEIVPDSRCYVWYYCGLRSRDRGSYSW